MRPGLAMHGVTMAVFVTMLIQLFHIASAPLIGPVADAQTELALNHLTKKNVIN